MAGKSAPRLPQRYQQQLARGVMSLNENQRCREIAEQEARETARTQARAQRPALPQTQYEITLKNAGTDGLPAPVTVAVPPPSRTATNDASGTTPVTPAAADKIPAPDTTIEETKRILADYIELSATAPAKTAVSGPAPATTAGR